MTDVLFAHVRRCLDVTEADIVRATETREACQALLARIAAVARPQTGAPKLLLVVARLGTTACDWIDGGLRVDLVGDEQVTVCEIMTELGGVRERVFPPLPIPVPLAELAGAVQRMPHMIEPLEIAHATDRRLTLRVSQQIRMSSLPPPLARISDASLFAPGADAAALPIETYSLHVEMPSEAPGAAPASIPVAFDDGWDLDRLPKPKP